MTIAIAFTRVCIGGLCCGGSEQTIASRNGRKMKDHSRELQKFPGSIFGFRSWAEYAAHLPSWPQELYLPLAVLYSSRSRSCLERACRSGELAFAVPSPNSPKVIRRDDLDSWLAQQEQRKRPGPKKATKAPLVG